MTAMPFLPYRAPSITSRSRGVTAQGRFRKAPAHVVTSPRPGLSLAVVAAVAALTVFEGFAFAHHGVAWYDYSKTVFAKKVTVVQYEWINPHCKIYFDVLDDEHHVQHWMVEMHPPENLLAHGWTRQTLHPGDVISISFRPAKDGSNKGLVDEVTIPNGVQLRQNYLLLPVGDKLTIQQWQKYVRERRNFPTNH